MILDSHHHLWQFDQARLPWKIEDLHWRHYINDVHVKGLRKWVFPHLEAKLTKRPRPEDRFSDLVAFLNEIADREGGNIAVQRLVHGADGAAAELVGVSYRDLRRRAHACANRLADVGVHPGTHVALIAKNSPEWAIAFFGVLAAGASVVPLDPALSSEELGRRMKEVGAAFALVDNDGFAPEDTTQCTGAGFDVPAVAMGRLPAHGANVARELDFREFPLGFGTPIEAALRGATQFCQQFERASNGEKCVAVLVTERRERSCYVPHPTRRASAQWSLPGATPVTSARVWPVPWTTLRVPFPRHLRAHQRLSPQSENQPKWWEKQ